MPDTELHKVKEQLENLINSTDQDINGKFWSNYQNYLVEFNTILSKLHSEELFKDESEIAEVPPDHRGAYGMIGSQEEQAKLREINHSSKRLLSAVNRKFPAPTSENKTATAAKPKKNLIERYKSSVLAQVLSIAIPCIAITWLVSDEIRVKPKAERIETLEKDFARLGINTSNDSAAAFAQYVVGHKGLLTQIPIFTTIDSVDRVEQIRLELENEDYDLLTRGWVSYEVAQLVAFSATPSGNTSFSIDHIISFLEHAATNKVSSITTVNAIEISGNLGIMQRATYPTVKDTIVSLLTSIQASKATSSDYVDELARVKLAILGSSDKQDLKNLISELSSGKRHSFYEEGLFENPDYWLPFLIGESDIGNARFYAAHLLRKVNFKHKLSLKYNIAFLIERESQLGKQADLDVIDQLRRGYNAL